VDLSIPEDGVVTLTAVARRRFSCEYAPMYDEVGQWQFVLNDKPKKSPAPKLGADYEEDDRAITIYFGETTVKIDKATGLISDFTDEGEKMILSPVTPTLWRAPTDNDRNIRLAWEEHKLDELSPTCYGTRVSKNEDSVTVISEIAMGYPSKRVGAMMNITYTFAKGSPVKIDLDAKINDNLPHLPRLGFKFTMPEGFEMVKYFGYGPMESYEDKRLAARLGLFETTATENFEPYVRPQENSAHFGTRIAAISSVWGHSMVFGANSFSLSVSHFSPEYLSCTKHNYELIPERETTVIIDYRNSAIGSNSCGPELDEKYKIDEKHINFSFSIMPLRVGICDLEKLYEKL
jgi:beta-galactosidase